MGTSVKRGTMEAISGVANLFSAIGTVGAVVVALFLQHFNIRRARPRLSLGFSDELYDEDVVLVDLDNPNLFIRLKVWADRGRDVARNVQVLLLRIDRPVNTAPTPAVPSRNLKWADTPNEKLDVPAGIWRRVDFLNLWADKTAPDAHSLLPMLYQYDEQWPPNSRHFLRDPGTYRATLAVVADNADSTFWAVDFHYAPGPVGKLVDLCSQLRVTEVKVLRDQAPASVGNR
jgi:hypothetical protein